MQILKKSSLDTGDKVVY